MADLDPGARYARSLGFSIAPKTVIVEGRTDFDLCMLAARYEHREAQALLLGCDLAVTNGGDGDEGGTAGVIRQLITLRNIARTDLGPKGSPRYRFVALFDDDRSGRQAVRAARDLDRSIIEFKDVFRLRPMMPMISHADPTVLERRFREANEPYRNIEWELEDLLGAQLLSAFCEEHPNAISRESRAADLVHRDFTRDGKARPTRQGLRHTAGFDKCHGRPEGVQTVFRPSGERRSGFVQRSTLNQRKIVRRSCRHGFSRAGARRSFSPQLRHWGWAGESLSRSTLTRRSGRYGSPYLCCRLRT
ncbi:MAG TPA: hypothetical protein VMR62_14755 [Bryobacteraceae bacterium]|nr:hypothetical protein [Bryobacteraceae bacterium]